MGLIPALVALAGRRDRDAVPLGRLATSLARATTGVALISYQALGQDSADRLANAWGVACAFAPC